MLTPVARTEEYFWVHIVGNELHSPVAVQHIAAADMGTAEANAGAEEKAARSEGVAEIAEIALFRAMNPRGTRRDMS